MCWIGIIIIIEYLQVYVSLQLVLVNRTTLQNSYTLIALNLGILFYFFIFCLILFLSRYTKWRSIKKYTQKYIHILVFTGTTLIFIFFFFFSNLQKGNELYDKINIKTTMQPKYAELLHFLTFTIHRCKLLQFFYNLSFQ